MSGSVYERRDLGWRDRLRRRFGREEPGPAPLCEPLRIVVERGRPVGFRRQDGGVYRVAEPPSDPSQWPEDWWGTEPVWRPLRWR